jgi:hypothetical protein
MTGKECCSNPSEGCKKASVMQLIRDVHEGFLGRIETHLSGGLVALPACVNCVID